MKVSWKVVLVLILAIILLQQPKAAKKMADGDPEVLFRTDIVAPYGWADGQWIALRYDTATYTATQELIPYAFAGWGGECIYSTGSATIGSEYTMLPYTTPSGAPIAYINQDANQYIYIFDNTNCVLENYTQTVFVYDNSIGAELSVLPTEPYLSNGQEVYDGTPPVPCEVTFTEFIQIADAWVDCTVGGCV